MITRRLVPVAIALVLAVPAGLAAWGGKGGYEPSTNNDRNDGWMFAAGDTTATKNQVYLNSYITDGSIVITPESPNNAIIQSQLTTASPEPVAILGVWKDCNGDGYIGIADGNVGLEYSSTLLLDSSICPATSGPLQHNDGTTVHEFFPIVWDNLTNTMNHGGIPRDNFTIVDSGARVWADKGTPTSPNDTPCHLNPQPQGTFHSSGGTLGWIDCNDGFLVTSLANAAGSVGGVQVGFNDVQPGDNGNSASVLNQEYPLGESNGDDTAVAAWDCTSGTPVTIPEVDDPTGSGQFGSDNSIVNEKDITVYGPSTTPSVNPSGSVLGTENRTEWDAVQDCGTEPYAPIPASWHGGLHGENGHKQSWTRADNADCAENMADMFVYFKQPAYVCEAAQSGTVDGRNRPDVEFFQNGPTQRHVYTPPSTGPANPGCNAALRNNHVQGTGAACIATVNDALNPVVEGAGATDDYNSLNDTENGVFNGWFDDYTGAQMSAGAFTSQVWETFDKVSFQFGIDRNTNPAPPQYITTYAFVSPAAVTKFSLALPHNTVTGSYGSEACIAHTGAFDCDASHWWKDPDGNNVPMPDQVDFHQVDGSNRACGASDTYSPQSDATCAAAAWGLLEPRTFLGAPFNLRDVDCYDESIGAERGEFGTPDLTPQALIGTPCA